MAKFIIDTDLMVTNIQALPITVKSDGHIINSLRAAHSGKKLEPWLTPYQEKKKRGMDGKGAYSELFKAFWKAYPPRNGQMQGKRPAFKYWCKHANDYGEKLLFDICIVALEWQVLTDDWRKDNGMFIPMARSYLCDERFQDEQPEGLAAGKKMVRNSEGHMVEVDI